MKFFLGILLSFTALFSGLSAQTSWYVNQQSGSNSNNGMSPSTAFKTVDYATGNSNFVQPGDTLFLIGTFTNTNYNPTYTYSGNISDPHIWHAQNSIKLNNLNGLPGNYITIKSFNGATLIKGDGANIFRVSNSSFLRIEDLHIQGEVDNIPYTTAKALQFLWDSLGTVVYRVPPGTPDPIIETMTFPILGSVSRPSYSDTRGLYLSNVHHIDILNNTIHHTPGGGLRVSDCDYINIIGNSVHNCSRKSFSGTHALVVTNASSVDNFTGYKINILKNKVFYNYNEIYSWSPTKSIITPYIDEGKGISLQRNNLTGGSNWSHGRFLVANNICYWNGYSGIHSNDGIRMDFINNTCYVNSYTKSITYPGSTNGGNIGISTQGGDDIKMINNISIIDSGLSKSALSAASTTNLVVINNLIYGTSGAIDEDPDIVAVQVNTIQANPQFTNGSGFDFSLLSTSPAIGAAHISYAPTDDFSGTPRDANPDLGALEFFNVLPIELLNFVATLEKSNKVQLQWTTLSELNNDYFVIERSNEGNQWEEIGKIEGAKKASLVTNYSFDDFAPIQGVNYYRLKQVDYDHAFTYSNIVSVELPTYALQVFPNPSNSNLHVRTKKAEINEISVYNHLGKDCTTQVKFDSSFPNSDLTLQVEALAAGLYWLRTNVGSTCFVKK